MRPADYLVFSSLSFIVLLEATVADTFAPAWLNVVVTAAACVVALLLALDSRDKTLRKEK